MFHRPSSGLFRRFSHFTSNAEPISFLCRSSSKFNSNRECKQIHAKLVLSQSLSQIHVANKLLHAYSKSEDLCSAHLLFDQMRQKSVVTWTSLISAYVHHGLSETALQLFEQMLGSNEMPNSHTFSIAIRACSSAGFVQLGMQIHGLIVRFGVDQNEFAGSCLVDFYLSVGQFDDAVHIFDGLHIRDCVTWNTMISGFAGIGDNSEVLRLFQEMQVVDSLKPNDFIFTSLLKCCSFAREVEQIHGFAFKLGMEFDVVVGNSLVDLYGKCGNMDSARKFFHSMKLKDIFSWSSFVSGCVKNGSGEEALFLFNDMLRLGIRPNQHVLSTVLKACVEMGDNIEGNQIHTQMIKLGFQSDCVVTSVLISLYANANEIVEAEKLFRKIANKDIVVWNSMMMCYANLEEGLASSCFSFFRKLRQTTTLEPDEYTLISLLRSCQSNGDPTASSQIHGMIMKLSLKHQTRIGNAIINVYSKCGAVEDAYKAFDETTQKDEISWSLVIGNYQQNGFGLKALELGKEMLANGIKLTSFSLPICIAACADLSAIDYGKQFHSLSIKLAFVSDAYLQSSLINMYSKCGNVEDSRKAFYEQKAPNEATFNALIFGFAQNGKATDAMEAFKEMEILGLIPNEITFLAVLSACGHEGLVEESLFYLDLMNNKYDIEPEPEHYACLVDVFGRAGNLEEAYRIIEHCGSVLTWKTLLGACRNYGNMNLAEKCAEKVMEFDPCDHASYVLLSNLYSGEGKWEEALMLKQKMVYNGVKKKNPGSSWLT